MPSLQGVISVATPAGAGYRNPAAWHMVCRERPCTKRAQWHDTGWLHYTSSACHADCVASPWNPLCSKSTCQGFIVQLHARPFTCLMQGEERRDRRKIRQLHTVLPTTPLTTALSLLLDAGVSVLPIIDAVRIMFLSVSCCMLGSSRTWSLHKMLPCLFSAAGSLEQAPH